MKQSLLLTVFTLIATLSFSQNGLGKWTTIDDKTGKKKSTVELFKQGDKMYGKITYLYPREGREPNPICRKCTDDRKNQPLVGLQVVRNMKWNGAEWEGGTIVDPETGKLYNVKIWVDSKNPNNLNVRGYVGPFFRTQTWSKAQ